MDESFSRAAFELKAGEISPPVRSPFGVHLIRCDEVLPGTKKVSDLAGPIDEALAKELLEKLSQLERKQDRGEIHVRLAAFQAGNAGVGEMSLLLLSSQGQASQRRISVLIFSISEALSLHSSCINLRFACRSSCFFRKKHHHGGCFFDPVPHATEVPMSRTKLALLALSLVVIAGIVCPGAAVRSTGTRQLPIALSRPSTSAARAVGTT